MTNKITKIESIEDGARIHTLDGGILEIIKGNERYSLTKTVETSDTKSISLLESFNDGVTLDVDDINISVVMSNGLGNWWYVEISLGGLASVMFYVEGRCEQDALDSVVDYSEDHDISVYSTLEDLENDGYDFNDDHNPIDMVCAGNHGHYVSSIFVIRNVQ